jgi:hypothetical protein
MSETLYLEGLNPLDAEELKEALGDNGMELRQPEVPEGMLAEPGTITVILTLGSFAAVDFALWLSKGRRRRLLKRSVRVIHPDGRIEEDSWEVKVGTDEAIKAAVIAQFGKWLKMK